MAVILVDLKIIVTMPLTVLSPCDKGGRLWVKIFISSHVKTITSRMKKLLKFSGWKSTFSDARGPTDMVGAVVLLQKKYNAQKRSRKPNTNDQENRITTILTYIHRT